MSWPRDGLVRAPRAGQRPEIVSGAVLYLKLSGPALYCYAISECLKRYLLAQVCKICESTCCPHTRPCRPALPPPFALGCWCSILAQRCRVRVQRMDVTCRGW